MFFPKRSNSTFPITSITFNVCVSALLGISLSAVLQRFNNIFFYNVFIGSIFSGTVSFYLAKMTKRKYYIEIITRAYIIIISVLLSFSFLSTVPLTIDRSYSVWLLKHVTEAQYAGTVIDRETLIEDSIDFFSAENGQLNRRIDEQVRIGNLEILDTETIQASSKGMLLAEINNLVGIIFGLEPKYSQLKTE
jgi:hypothetical protein